MSTVNAFCQTSTIRFAKERGFLGLYLARPPLMTILFSLSFALGIITLSTQRALVAHCLAKHPPFAIPIFAIILVRRYTIFKREGTHLILFGSAICIDTHISANTPPLTTQTIYFEENLDQLYDSL